MEKITAEEIRRFAPRAHNDYVAALVGGWSEIERAEQATPARLSAFLAETAHETGGFTIKAESLSYSAKRMCEVWPGRFRSPRDPRALWCAYNQERLGDAVYGGRLGNEGKGDGFRYRGRGFNQLTGRAAYREYGGVVGLDLEDNPELLETPTVSLRVALAYWNKYRLGELADRGYMRAVGNGINRGNPFSRYEPIGYPDRTQWYQRAWAVFGEGPPPSSPSLALGAYGPRVEGLQRTLHQLGYPTGSIDKVFGPATARAVAAFKLDFKRQNAGAALDSDELVGPATEQALQVAQPVRPSPDREGETAAGLLSLGSTEVRAGRAGQLAGTAVFGLAAADGLGRVGGLDHLLGVLAVLPKVQEGLAPVIVAVKWGLGNAAWVAALLGGVVLWERGSSMITARLRAHRSGQNMTR